jgi:hypothetical protein
MGWDVVWLLVAGYINDGLLPGYVTLGPLRRRLKRAPISDRLAMRFALLILIIACGCVALSATAPLVSRRQGLVEKVLTARDFDKWRDRSPSLEPVSFLISISPKLRPYRFHLIPDKADTPVDGRTHHVGRIDISSGELGGIVQTIEVDSTRNASDFIRFFTAQDFNFDGCLDFGLLKDFGAKWGSYSCYLFDPKSGRFVTNALTDELGKISANEMRADPASRLIRCDYLTFEGIISEAYKVEHTHLVLADQKERRKDRKGRFEVVTKRLVNGKMKIVRIERVEDPYKAADAN